MFIKALMLTRNYPPLIGGMERVMWEQWQALQLAGHEVHTIVPQLPKATGYFYCPSYRGLPAYLAYTFIKGFRLLRREQFNLIIAGSGLMTPIAVVLAKQFRCPVLVNVYGLDIIYPNPFYQRALRLALRQADSIITISQAAVAALLDREVKRHKITIIPPGTDAAEFDGLPDSLHLKATRGWTERRILFSAGRLAERKGIFTFVHNNLPSIVQAVPETLFVIAGGNPDDALAHGGNVIHQIQKAASQLGLSEHITLLGKVPRFELLELFKMADLFVLPAIEVAGDMEGFGIVLLEASAAGKAVVATSLGGIPDAVAHGYSGILVPKGERALLSQTIIKLLENEEERRLLGAQGRQRVYEEFDWSHIRQRYLELFCRIAK